jgi:surface polysaccharide O-acyltransferase-like enzyme
LEKTSTTVILKDSKRLLYFDYFRAFAISFIIFCHCYNNWQYDHLWETTLVNLISGGTALFVFISGFFFHHVYLPKYEYGAFLKNKIKTVFLPYLFLSSIAIAYFYIESQSIFMGENFDVYFDQQFSKLSLVIINLMTGKARQTYWYVPFAMFLFLLSPIFIRFIKLNLIAQINITAIFFVISMFLHRSILEINPIQNLLYFVPYYLLGITYSMERVKVNCWIEGKVALLFLMTILIAFLMSLFGQVGSVNKALFVYSGVDLMIFQKLSFILFMLAFTLYLQKYNLDFLKKIASISFALFFLHPWVLSVLNKIGMKTIEHGFAGAFFIFMIVTALTYIIAYLIKQMLGGKSKYLIGW